MNRPILLAALLPLATACGGDLGPAANLTGSDNPDATIFLAGSQSPMGVMDARFEGRVLRDAQGCLRLESSQPATVIWPLGSTLESRDGELYVKDAGGRELAMVGGASRFGGGYTANVEAGYLSSADRQLAETRCPGEYWIAAARQP
jgi:hypothetical protein